jgi:hypothetical protein
VRIKVDTQNATSAVEDMIHLEKSIQITKTTAIAKMETLDGKPKRVD